MSALGFADTPSWLWFGISALGTWRVSHLIQAEDGPGDVIVRLRLWAGDGVLGRGLDCFYCVSVWVSLPFAIAIAAGPLEPLLLWPALSGAAILLERAMAPETQVAGAGPSRKEEECPAVAANVRR
ncbi:MAG TPA: hypothetical protein VMV21_09630 [Vicinamibacteria bacterium]|nr:hypothetical protein [Vicinamibacteria bacterium]